MTPRRRRIAALSLSASLLIGACGADKSREPVVGVPAGGESTTAPVPAPAPAPAPAPGPGIEEPSWSIATPEPVPVPELTPAASLIFDGAQIAPGQLYVECSTTPPYGSVTVSGADDLYGQVDLLATLRDNEVSSLLFGTTEGPDGAVSAAYSDSATAEWRADGTLSITGTISTVLGGNYTFTLETPCGG